VSYATGREWQRIRKKVIQRDGFTCQDCGCLVSTNMDGAFPTAHVHHLTPRSEGGSDDPENLETLCRDCHGDEHDERGVAPDMDDTSAFGSQLENHPNWKGGRTVTSHGYVLVKRPDHPDADSRGYVYEHRLVAEEKLGRRLDSDEHVHHKNGDKQDNSPENIEVYHETEHRVEHRDEDSNRRKPGEPNPTVECACGCGETFKKYDEWGRPRERVSGHTEYSLATPAKDDILAVLRNEGPIHRKELAERVDRSLNIVSTHLSELRNEGKAGPIGGGDWATAEVAEEIGYERAAPAQEALLSLLKEDGPMHIDELAEKRDREKVTIQGTLADLADENEAERTAQGVWMAVGHPPEDPVEKLYPSKAKVVRTLQEEGPMKRSNLVESVEQSSETVSNYLNDLKKKGLVESAEGWGEWKASEV